ncbi:MAG: hypothetical protein ABW122_13175 [Ilumatobacteraceae bacterium]
MTPALEGLLGARPDYAAGLARIEVALREQQALDPVLLDLCRDRIRSLLGAPGPGLPDRPLRADERACLDLAEQIYVDATGVSDELVAATEAAIGHDGFVVLSYACGLFETTARAELLVEGSAP